MERIVIFRNTETNEELVMPVTPKEYQIEHGRRQDTVTLHMVGDVSVPGAAALIDEEPEFLLPRHDYPFNQPGTNLNPFVYLEKLEKWSDAAVLLRYVVAGTPINAPVRLGVIRYREQDGTNDIYCTVPIRGVRQLKAEEVEVTAAAVPLAARPVEADPTKAQTYIVVWGDTMGAICKRFYGDASLAPRLAKYNGVKNVNLIDPGLVLTIPPKGELPAAVSSGGGKVAATAAATVTVTVSYAGERANFGTVEISYTDEHGNSKSTSPRVVADSVSIKAKKGGKVSITRLKGKINYFTVGGHVAASGDSMSMTPQNDVKVMVYWKRAPIERQV